jgi:hypothetical protein
MNDALTKKMPLFVRIPRMRIIIEFDFEINEKISFIVYSETITQILDKDEILKAKWNKIKSRKKLHLHGKICNSNFIACKRARKTRLVNGEEKKMQQSNSICIKMYQC